MEKTKEEIFFEESKQMIQEKPKKIKNKEEEKEKAVDKEEKNVKKI